MQKVYYNPIEVGKRIKKVRIAEKVTQEDLSEEMCISREMLSRIENGKNTCAPDHLMFLCQRFDKKADYFYFGDEYEKSGMSRLEIINEIKEILGRVENQRLWEVYRVIQVLTEI